MNLLRTILAASCILLLGAGCQHFQDADGNIDEVRLAQITGITRAAVSITVNEVAGNDVNKRQAFVIAANAIDLVIDAENFNPDEVKTLINSTLASSNLSQYSPVVELGIALALDVYTAFYKANWKDQIQSQTLMVAVLASIRDGIYLGVGGLSTEAVSAASSDAKSALKDLTKQDLTVIR